MSITDITLELRSANTSEITLNMARRSAAVTLKLQRNVGDVTDITGYFDIYFDGWYERMGITALDNKLKLEGDK